MVSLVPIAHIVAAVFSIIELGLTSYGMFPPPLSSAQP